MAISLFRSVAAGGLYHFGWLLIFSREAIIISLPEEGSVYTFSRSVQVAENEPLKLDLKFGSRHALPYWQMAGALFTMALLGLAFVIRKPDSIETKRSAE